MSIEDLFQNAHQSAGTFGQPLSDEERRDALRNLASDRNCPVCLSFPCTPECLAERQHISDEVAAGLKEMPREEAIRLLFGSDDE